MTSRSLRQLDQRAVAVELLVAGETRVLRGVGNYDSASEVGPALRIVVPDPSGVFELLIVEESWKGELTVDTTHGCEFALRLVFREEGGGRTTEDAGIVEKEE